MKCKIISGDVMKIERDERRFDFHDIGLAIKRAREASGMTQEQLAYIVDRAPRTIMYNENSTPPIIETFLCFLFSQTAGADRGLYRPRAAESLSGPQHGWRSG